MKQFILFMLLLIGANVHAQNNLKLFDINPANSDRHMSLTKFKGEMFFYANDGKNGLELWSLDTINGMKMVADIYPGPKGGPWNNGIGFGLTNNCGRLGIAALHGGGNTDNLFFFANDGVRGPELYRYDGINPPVFCKEFIPGAKGIKYNGAAFSIETINNKLYFIDDSTRQLWEYDPAGGNARTIPNFNITDGTRHMVVFQNKIYISNAAGLWIYDPKTDKAPLANGSQIFIEGSNIVYDKLYFRGRTNANSFYVYDGAGIPEVIGCSKNMGFDPFIVGGYNGRVYFSGCDNKNVSQLCEYDPATKKLAFITQYATDFYPSSFLEFDGKLYFSAFSDTAGGDLYSYDGNTVILEFNMNPAANPSTTSAVFNLFTLGDGVYFISGGNIYRYTPSKLSVQPLSFNGNIQLYPNPATHQCTIAIDIQQKETIIIAITDITGREVHRSNEKVLAAGKTEVDIDIHHFNAGTYTYVLTGKDGRMLYSGRLVKQ